MLTGCHGNRQLCFVAMVNERRPHQYFCNTNPLLSRPSYKPQISIPADQYNRLSESSVPGIRLITTHVPDNSVGRLQWLDDPGIVVRIPPQRPDRHPTQWVPGAKRPKRKGDHSPPSADVKYAWKYTSAPSYVFTT